MEKKFCTAIFCSSTIKEKPVNGQSIPECSFVNVSVLYGIGAFWQGNTMDITMGIICLFLEKQYNITENGPVKKDCPVKGFRVWNGEQPGGDLLYMEENISVTRRYYQSKIEDLFHDCCVLEDDERVCCIRNLSVSGQKDWDVRQELSVFLRDNLCRAGISHKFTDISLLHRYYLEAQYALDLGLLS